LKPIEKKRIAWLTLSVYLAFVVGVVLGYFFILPAVLDAIVRFGSEREQALWTLSAYINTALGVLIVSAVFMEIPVVMLHLTSWGWVDLHVWTKGRKIALVSNAVVSGILSPPDLMSMVVMMIPVQLLYEAGILLARVAKWVKNEKKT
jgi:sec-independent protein translocase protein TatC